MQINQDDSNQQSDQEQCLQQILSKYQANEFVDAGFQHNYDNIYKKQIQLQRMQPVIWMPCEELHHKPFYSSGKLTFRDIQRMRFSTGVINQALFIIKYSITGSFQKLTKNRQLSYGYENHLIKHLYEFQVSINKSLQKVYIDSYVPVSQVRNKQLFAQTYEGGVFPCLIQKLLAKVLNGYQNIQSTPLPCVIQILSSCVQQKVNLNTFEGQQQQKVLNFIQTNHDQANLIFFRTRNNPKLESFGLRHGHCYLILGVVKLKNENANCDYYEQVSVMRFLELSSIGQLDKKHQDKRWVGKWSRFRVESQMIKQRSEQLKQYQNFMSIKDLNKVVKSFTLLHNIENSSLASLKANFQKFVHLFPNKKQTVDIIQNTKQKQTFPYSQQKSVTSIRHHKVQNFYQNDGSIQLKINQTQKQLNNFVSLWKVFKIYQKQNGSFYQSYDSQNKILINLRIDRKSGRKSKKQYLKINNLNLIILPEISQKIVMMRNLKAKFKSSSQGECFDYLFELQSQILKLVSSSKELFYLIVFLDGFTAFKDAQEICCRLKISKYQLGSKIQKINITTELNKQKFIKLLFIFFKSLIHSKNKQQSISPNIQIKNEPIQIICRQFIDTLNMAIIYIKLNSQMNQPNQIKVEINNRILIENGIYLFQKFGSIQSWQSTDGDDVQTFKIELNQQHPEAMFIVKIYLSNNSKIDKFKNHNQNPQLIQNFQFPPKDSIKICRMYENNV